MLSQYINQVKGNVSEAITTLSKASYKPQFLLVLGIQVVTFVITYLTFGDSLSPLMEKLKSGKIENPNELLALLPQNMGVIGLVVAIFSLVSMAWYYSFSLSINDQIIRKEKLDVGSAMSASVGNQFPRIILYFFLIFGIVIVAIVAMGIISGLMMALSKILGVLIIFIAALFFFVFIVRIIAGPAFIVHGNQSPIDALKSSFKHVTWLRALIILVLGVVVSLVIFLLSYIIGLVTNPLFSDAYLQNQVPSIIVNIIIGPILAAAASSLYFRYAESDENEGHIEDHLVSES